MSGMYFNQTGISLWFTNSMELYSRRANGKNRCSRRYGTHSQMLLNVYSKADDEFGMPISLQRRSMKYSSFEACTLLHAVRCDDPTRYVELLRELRMIAMTTLEDISQIDTLSRAAEALGHLAQQVREWIVDETNTSAVRVQMTEARSPTAEAVAMRHKLAKHGEGWRYTAGLFAFELQRSILRFQVFNHI